MGEQTNKFFETYEKALARLQYIGSQFGQVL